MPAESKAQRGFAGMSLTKKGRAILRAHGKKPMPMDVAKEFVHGKPKKKRSERKK